MNILSPTSFVRAANAFRTTLTDHLRLGLTDRKTAEAAMKILQESRPSPIGKVLYKTDSKEIASRGAHFHGGRADVWLEHAAKREQVIITGSGLYVGPVELAAEYAKFHSRGALVLVTPTSTEPFRDDDTGTNLYFPADVAIEIKAIHEINQEYISKELEIFERFIAIKTLKHIVTDATEKAFEACKAEIGDPSKK